jgi:hypothetical protein
MINLEGFFENREDRLVKNIKIAYEQGGILAAMELCRNTKGKSAYVAYEVLDMLKDKK